MVFEKDCIIHFEDNTLKCEDNTKHVSDSLLGLIDSNVEKNYQVYEFKAVRWLPIHINLR